MKVKPRASVASTYSIHRGRNSAMSVKLRRILNAAVYEGYTKQSKLTDYFTHK